MARDARLSPTTSPGMHSAPYVHSATPTPPPLTNPPMLAKSPMTPINEPPTADADSERKQQPEQAAAVAAPPVAKVNKILFLDGLRGLAAMMVVVEHSKWLGVGIGQPAVDTFFVLSAFLLTMIFERKARTLLKEGANAKRWGWALLDYFLRRFLRVYPLFAVIAIALACLSDEDRGRYFVFRNPDDYNLFKTLIFSFDYRYHVFWTLPLEIMYYFLIPVFVVITIGLRKLWFVPFVPLIYWIVWSGFTIARYHHQPLAKHLPTFILGSIAAVVYVKAEQFIASRKIVLRWPHWVVIRSIEYFFLAVYFSVQFKGLFFDWVYHNPVSQEPKGEKFVAVNISIVMVAELLLPGAVASILEWSLLRYAGKISYSLYLLHSFVVYLPWVREQTYWNKYWATWWLTFLLSTVSYHVIEYPCLWFAGRIGKIIKAKDEEEKKRQKEALPVVGESSSTTTEALP